MVVIQKKRIIYVCFIIFISLFIYGVTTENNDNIIQTVAVPVTNKVIVLDAGHGIPDERSRK